MDKDSSEHERGFILSTGGYRLWSGHVEHVAFDQNDKRYRVTADSDGYVLRQITLQRPNDDRPLIVIPDERIHLPDLQSLRITSATGEMVSIEIEYGTPRRWCFDNIEGQPSVTFNVEYPRKLEALRQDYEGCQVNAYKPVKAHLEVGDAPKRNEVKSP